MAPAHHAKFEWLHVSYAFILWKPSLYRKKAGWLMEAEFLKHVGWCRYLAQQDTEHQYQEGAYIQDGVPQDYGHEDASGYHMVQPQDYEAQHAQPHSHEQVLHDCLVHQGFEQGFPFYLHAMHMASAGCRGCQLGAALQHPSFIIARANVRIGRQEDPTVVGYGLKAMLCCLQVYQTDAQAQYEQQQEDNGQVHHEDLLKFGEAAVPNTGYEDDQRQLKRYRVR